jgi:catechol 2,3-dioxygenase-like lactoylglutathione lyase family enzyme
MQKPAIAIRQWPRLPLNRQPAAIYPKWIRVVKDRTGGCTSDHRCGTGRLIFRFDDVASAVRRLAAEGMRVIDGQDLHAM